jgi:hypothetical protein
MGRLITKQHIRAQHVQLHTTYLLLQITVRRYKVRMQNHALTDLRNVYFSYVSLILDLVLFTSF